MNNAKLGYEKGVPFTKQKTVQFNPNSRKHIEYNLRKKYDWKPQVFTLQGDAKIDETVRVRFPTRKRRSWHGPSCYRNASVSWPKARTHGCGW